MSTLTQVPLIPDPGPSQATPGLWNRTFSVLSQNADQVAADVRGAVGSVTGTANEITVSSSTGNPVFSLPSVVSLPGTLDVMSTTSLGGNVISGLTVVGAAKFNSTLTVAGQLTSNSSLSVGGNVQVGSSITAGRESYASAFYLTPPLKGALSSVMDFGYPDVGIGCFRSGNSATIRWSGGTWREEGSGMDVSVLTSRSNLAATKQVLSGQGGNAGGFVLGAYGQGILQNTAGVNFTRAAAPATVMFGIDSSGHTYFVGTGPFTSTVYPSIGTYPVQVTGDTVVNGSVNLLQNRLLSLRTIAGSVDSTSLAVGELAVSFGASGSSLAYRSAGTIWFVNSSLSTVG